jgi:AraC-like DNA-binding protein
MATEWLSVKEAAAELGYSETYFRREFCSASAPLVEILVRNTKRGKRRILVSSASIAKLMAGQTVKPA